MRCRMSDREGHEKRARGFVQFSYAISGHEGVGLEPGGKGGLLPENRADDGGGRAGL